jgi:hypothetical protein
MKLFKSGRISLTAALAAAFFSAFLIPHGNALSQIVETPVAKSAPQGPDRSGFTLLLTMGVGFQKLGDSRDWETGLGGLNLGIGGFVSPDLAVMFRLSGTTVQYGIYDIVSGVGGPGVQYWVSDSFNLEGALGLGFVDYGGGWNQQAVGMLLGMGYSFYHKKKTSFQLGLEYGHVFTGSGVHSLVIAFGWQLL